MMKQLVAFGLTSLAMQTVAWSQQQYPEAGAGERVYVPAPADEATSPLGNQPFLQDVYAGVALGSVFYRDNTVEGGDGFDMDFEPGGLFAVYAGKRLGSLRAEIEITNQGAEFDPSNSQFEGDANLSRFTASAFVDVTTLDVSWAKGGVTPYIGGGAGFAVIDIESVDNDDVGFTAHGEVGVSIPIVHRIDVVPAYRLEWADFDDLEKDHYAHTIRIGARYNF